ncbi:hypothetical protein [Pseudonocardia sp. GCM10023141]|uniref:hypothetical protein n=1 Tax=Pseudonocardia sp. GCM10023141 TaxID=3252653 RepID=UPI00361275E2
MSDDDKLAALFRDAASEPGAPPPAFGHDDVVLASYKIGRRRTAMARGALGVLIVAGIGAAVVLPGQFQQSGTTTAAAPYAATEGPAVGNGVPAAPPLNNPEQGYAQPGQAGGAAGGSAADKAVPAPAPAQAAPAPGSAAPAPEAPDNAPVPTPPPAQAGGAPAAAAGAAPFTGTPLGPGTAACADRQDPQLRAYLEQALPEAVGAKAAATTMECRPAGERGVNIEVSDARAPGLLTVLYEPPGARPPPAQGDARTASAVTASGGTVVVSVRPATAGGPVPFADRLGGIVSYLVPRL